VRSLPLPLRQIGGLLSNVSECRHEWIGFPRFKLLTDYTDKAELEQCLIPRGSFARDDRGGRWRPLYQKQAWAGNLRLVTNTG